MFNFFKKKSNSNILSEIIEENKKEKLRKAYKQRQEYGEMITNQIDYFFEYKAEYVLNRYINILKQTLSDINNRPFVKSENRIITPPRVCFNWPKNILENVEEAVCGFKIELWDNLSELVTIIGDEKIKKMHTTLIENRFNDLYYRVKSEAINACAEAVKNAKTL